jgi:hypothetical protein
MADRGNGGIIGPINAPTDVKASGLWTLEEQKQARQVGKWPSGQQISRSLRFNSADGTSLDRTPSSATNRQTFTLSFWAKNPSTAGAITTFYSAGTDTNNNDTVIGYWDGLYVQNNLAGVQWRIRTTAVFRDPSAWYHYIFAFDLGNGTQANRLKIYVNGVESAYSGADGSSLPSTANTQINNNIIQYIGRRHFSSTNQATDAYMTEVNFIDGQALTPSSFGEYNADTGVWQPKRYAGSYGTNGFYLNFSDNSNTTAATLGADYSGNGNNWTPNNFSVSAGAGNDSLVDVPTNFGVDTGVGGTVRGNYCTINPLNANGSTLSNGNLDVTTSTIGGGGRFSGTFAMRSGKWYWEVTPTAVGSQLIVGIASSSETVATEPGFTALSYSYFSINGQKYNSSIGSSYGSTYTTGDVIGVALDMDAGTIVFYKNGVSQGTAFSSLSGEFVPAFSPGSSTAGTTVNINFGQRPFAHTAPSGFKALNTQNLPTPTIGATPATQAGKFFAPALYAGNNGTNTVTTGIDMSTNGALVWIKNRSTIIDHIWVDPVRGYNKYLSSNSTAAEDTFGFITSTSSNGFTVDTASNAINGSGSSYVAWNWKANGAGVTNTAGSITSTVSANTTSGFSVVTWAGNGSAGATIGHGLGAAPAMIIVKVRNDDNNWPVYHKSVGAANWILLNTTGASAANTAAWNNTAPTSTVFTVGTSGATNQSTRTYVAYCFSEVPGYSKFGSYTGNGSADGPFVFCGFRPAYVIYKGSSTSGGAWDIHDTARSPRNVAVQTLFANTSGAEGGIEIDILSNGFKIRDTSGNVNSNGVTYIFAAFAEAPQKFSLGR